jgi:hypothetical protein
VFFNAGKPSFSRRAIGVTERQRYILRVRTLSRSVAETYVAQREKLGFPALKNTLPKRVVSDNPLSDGSKEQVHG